MNFSHGEYEYHQSVIDNTRKMVAGEFRLIDQRSRIWLTRTYPQPTPLADLLRLRLTLCVQAVLYAISVAELTDKIERTRDSYGLDP
jgi:hypothetical protein